MARPRAEVWQITQVGFRASLNSDRPQDRALFGKVCDALGVTADYIRRDVMGDLHSKLIDEAWFGRARTPSPDGPGRQTGHAPQSATVDVELNSAKAKAAEAVELER